MSRWELPPKGGHMELPTEIYYQTMTDRQAKERLEKMTSSSHMRFLSGGERR
jgi:hypothetical protein